MKALSGFFTSLVTRRTISAWLTAIILITSLYFLSAATHLFIDNPTQSLPRGKYIRTFAPIRLGSLIWFPLPSAMNEYVSNMPATAAWFARPGHGLLKHVVGLPGDIICRDRANVFSVNGQPLGIAPVVGPIGKPLPIWQGCRLLALGEIAVFSSDILDSIDSRLYGAIPSNTARAYRLLYRY